MSDKITHGKGCFWEGGGFEIEIDKEVEAAKSDACEHLVLLQNNEKQGVWNIYLAPAVVVADNEAVTTQRAFAFIAFLNLLKSTNWNYSRKALRLDTPRRMKPHFSGLLAQSHDSNSFLYKMKASVFIKIALLEQMQQIADLGLWFHLSRLIPSGVELLGRVRFEGAPFMYEGNVFLPGTIERVVKKVYFSLFPPEYKFYPEGKDFFSVYPQVFLTSHEDEAHRHLTVDENGVKYVHVPQWFSDFKAACKIVLDEIERGAIKDIEVLRTLEK